MKNKYIVKLNSEQKDYKVTKKILLIGDPNVGKTSFLKRYLNDEYDNIYSPTIGTNIKSSYVSCENNIYKLNFWDVSGQDKYRNNIQSYYKNIDGIILMYDVNDMDTFVNIKYWMSEINKYSSGKIIVSIVGNKFDDLTSEYEVDDILGINIASKFNCKYNKISIKNNINVDNVIYDMIFDIVHNK